jgi:HSP20 family protein
MSLFDDDWEKRNRRNPFDFFGRNDEFDKIFREIENRINEMFSNFDPDMIKPGSSFVQGFNINFDSEGKPRVEKFGNQPLKKQNGELSISEEREPLTDIIEGDNEVFITTEIPGIEKEDIDLNVTKSNLEINVDNPKRKYHKILDLPCDVVAKTTKASYKNGILDIVIKRKEKKSNKDGYRVNIE